VNNPQPVRVIAQDYAKDNSSYGIFQWVPHLFITASHSGYSLSIAQSGVIHYTDKFDIDTEIAHGTPSLQPVEVDPGSGSV
jgi:hypothetical protein